jgi:hypothetical protein
VVVHYSYLAHLKVLFTDTKSKSGISASMSGPQTTLSKAIPAFEDLPLRSGDPPYSAWGLWENPGLGALNHLTDEVVLRTVKEEVKTGTRVGLK